MYYVVLYRNRVQIGISSPLFVSLDRATKYGEKLIERFGDPECVYLIYRKGPDSDYDPMPPSHGAASEHDLIYRERLTPDELNNVLGVFKESERKRLN